MENEQSETDAISMLENTYKAKKDFSYKQRAGEIKIRGLKRKIREAKAALETNPDDAQIKASLEELTGQLNDAELEHYKLSMQNYPTNLAAKYEYALRLVRNKQYNEAIPLFQESQKDPRRKIASMNQIGFCFFMKGWLADAIDVFNRAIESHEVKDDAAGKELRYNLARAYEEQGDKEKALEIYRKIAQLDFGYKDVSQRVDKLRSQKTEPTSQ